MDPKTVSIKTWKAVTSIEQRLARIEEMLNVTTAVPVPSHTPEPLAAEPKAPPHKDRKHG